MNLKINFPNLARQMLPSFKRKPVRLAFARALLIPLQRLFSLFDTWRNKTRIDVGMTGQTGMLEGYLRDKYGSDDIRILTYTTGGLPVGMKGDGRGHVARVSIKGDERQYAVEVPMRGEYASIFEDFDFVVFIPSWVDQESVRNDVERFKIALTTFKIIKE